MDDKLQAAITALDPAMHRALRTALMTRYPSVDNSGPAIIDDGGAEGVIDVGNEIPRLGIGTASGASAAPGHAHRAIDTRRLADPLTRQPMANVSTAPSVGRPFSDLVVVAPRPEGEQVGRIVTPREAAGLLMHQPFAGLDLETTGLDPLTDRIRLITLSTPEAIFAVDTQADPNWMEALRGPLEDQTILKVLHNASFDIGFVAESGVAVAPIFDTMLAAQLVDAGTHFRTKGYFTLKELAQRELGRELNKEAQVSDWGAPSLTDAQMEYAFCDAAVLLPLHHSLQSRLSTMGLREAAELEFSVIPAISWLERVGAPFDGVAWKALALQAEESKLQLRDEIAAVLGEGINLNSPLQIKQALVALGIALESTSEAALHAVRARHAVIDRLLLYKKAAKLSGTYGTEFFRHRHPKTGRIHAQYRQLGAETGRMTCSRPNLQQIPHDDAYRRCFRAPEGRVLVRADLNLVEMRVAAQLSGDRRMIQALIDGQDLHSITAAALFRSDGASVTPSQRAFGKSVNFGTLYGQGRRGLMQQAEKHGLQLSESQADTFRERFVQAWPELAVWQRRLMAGTQPGVRTVSGRLRMLAPGTSGAMRVNTPVQGTAADGFKAALAELWETHDRHPSAVLVLAVHDEIVMECDLADAEEVAAWLSNCLEAGMGRYLTKVPVRVDVRTGITWASV